MEFHPVSWTLFKFIFGGVRCNDIERLIRRSLGDNWWNWSDPGGRLKSWRASSSRPHSRSRPGWPQKQSVDAGKRADGPTSAEREELGRLRRENHRLRQERDILAKAAAWFARESKASPNGFTGS